MSASSSSQFWSVVITTPRPKGASYVRDTLASCGRAGLYPIVCTDSPPNYLAGLRSPIVHLKPRGERGAWQAWLAAATHLLKILGASPHVRSAWAILLEDDVELTENLVEYLRRYPPPDDALASLYCAAPNAEPESSDDKWCRWKQINAPQRAYGALAYMLRPRLLARILEAPPRPRSLHGTDHNLGLFCRDNGVPYVVHTPSLAAHRGTISSVPEAGIEANRQCRNWAGRWSDAIHAFHVIQPHESPHHHTDQVGVVGAAGAPTPAG